MKAQKVTITINDYDVHEDHCHVRILMTFDSAPTFDEVADSKSPTLELAGAIKELIDLWTKTRPGNTDISHEECVRELPPQRRGGIESV